MPKGNVGTDVFTVAEVPKFARANGDRVTAIDDTMSKVPADGTVSCIRQYDNRGGAQSRATSLRKRYGADWDIKVGPLEDGRAGVFVSAKVGSPVG